MRIESNFYICVLSVKLPNITTGSLADNIHIMVGI